MQSQRKSRRTIIKSLASATIAGIAYAAGSRPAAALNDMQRKPPLPRANLGSTLRILRVGEDWARVLRETPRVQLEPGGTYVLENTIELPDGCTIQGNGATVTVAHDSVTAFAVTRRRGVSISDLTLRGRPESPIGMAPSFEHVALRITRSFDVRVENCDIANWRGAAIVLTGSTADDYFAYRTKVVSNDFRHCYFGISMADRAEYGQLTANNFTSCRLAIWNSCGNWTMTGNLIVACHGGYYAIDKPSPYGKLASDNWCHGTLVGNTFNHCNGGAEQLWSANATFPVDGVMRDPGPGIVVEGVLPPTFTGNTLWYSDIEGRDLLGTRWLLSGCVMSNLAVRCHGSVPIELAGTQANGNENLPRLIGNVKSLF